MLSLSNIVISYRLYKSTITNNKKRKQNNLNTDNKKHIGLDLNKSDKITK